MDVAHPGPSGASASEGPASTEPPLGADPAPRTPPAPTIRPLTEHELPAVVALAAAAQQDPARHCGYLGVDVDGLTTELRELEPAGLAGTLVAWSADRPVGLLGVSWDVEPPRVWWHGPLLAADLVAPVEVADDLLRAGRRLLPADVQEEEFAPDDANRVAASLARRHGFAPGVASAVLRRSLVAPARAQGSSRPRPPAGVEVRVPTVTDRGPLARLHDQLFPGTHLVGERIAPDDDRYVLVAHRAGVVLGYVVAERQGDGAGYLDYLGVEPSSRGRGIGALLVSEVCDRLVQRWACAEVHLTVREDLPAARRLYARLGFREERLLRPWRLGFAVAPPGPAGP